MTTSSFAKTPRSRKLVRIVPIVTLGAGVALPALLNVGLSATDEMEFCKSCHSMKINFHKKTLPLQKRLGGPDHLR
jgi:cytochrome c-type protein NapC